MDNNELIDVMAPATVQGFQEGPNLAALKKHKLETEAVVITWEILNTHLEVLQTCSRPISEGSDLHVVLGALYDRPVSLTELGKAVDLRTLVGKRAVVVLGHKMRGRRRTPVITHVFGISALKAELDKAEDFEAIQKSATATEPAKEAQ